MARVLLLVLSTGMQIAGKMSHDFLPITERIEMNSFGPPGNRTTAFIFADTYRLGLIFP